MAISSTLNMSHHAALASKLRYYLKIDKVVTRQRKLKLYELAVCSTLCWYLSVHQITLYGSLSTPRSGLAWQEQQT